MLTRPDPREEQVQMEVATRGVVAAVACQASSSVYDLAC